MLRQFYFIFCITMFIMTRVRLMTAETKNILMNNDSVGPLSEQPEFEPQRYSGPGSSLGITYERKILADKTARKLLRSLSLSPDFAKYGMNSPTTESKPSSLLEPLKTSNPTQLPIPNVPIPSKPPDPTTVSSPSEQPTLPTSNSQQEPLVPSKPPVTPKPVSQSSPSMKPSSNDISGPSSIIPQISPGVYPQKSSQDTLAESPKPVKTFSWSTLFGSRPSKPPVAPEISEPSKLTGSATTSAQTTPNEQSGPPTPPISSESSTGNDNLLTNSETLSNSKNSSPSDSMATKPVTSSTTQPQKPSDGPVQVAFKSPSINVPPTVATPTVSATSATSVEPSAHTTAPLEVSKPPSTFSFSKLFQWKTTKPTPAETGSGSPSGIPPIPSPPLSASAKPSVPASSPTVAEPVSEPSIKPATTVNSATSAFSETSAVSLSSPSTQDSKPAPVETVKAPTTFRFQNLFWKPAKPAAPATMGSYNPPDTSPSSTTLPASTDQSGSATAATPAKPSTQNKIIPPPLESSKASSKLKFPSLFSWKSDMNQSKRPSGSDKSMQGSESVTPSTFSHPGEGTYPQTMVTPSGAAESSAGIASLGSSLEALQSTLFSTLSPPKIPPNSAVPVQDSSSLTSPQGFQKPQLPTSTLSSPSSWHSKHSSKFSSSFASPSSSSLFSTFSSSSSTTTSTSSSSFTTTSTSVGPAQTSSEAFLPTHSNPSGSRVKPGRLSSNINFNDLFGSIMSGFPSIRKPSRWSSQQRSISKVGRSLSTKRNLISEEDEKLPFETDAELEEGENQLTLEGDIFSEKHSNTINNEIPSKTLQKLHPFEDKDLIPAQMKSTAKDGSSLSNNDKLSAINYEEPSLGPNRNQMRNEQFLSSTQSSQNGKKKDLNENSIENRLEDQSTNEIERDSEAKKNNLLQETN